MLKIYSVRAAITIIAVAVFSIFIESRTKALISEANGELIPVYVEHDEVVFGEYLTELTDPDSFVYEKATEEFVPVDCSLNIELQEYTWLMCKANGIDFSLVMGLMKNESEYKESAVSKTGDYGLMQINKINHEWLSEELGVTNYLDAKQNINAGVYILGNLFEKYQDTSKVLMAYNMGESNAKKLWKDGIYESRYSRKIMQYQADIREQLEKQN